MKNIGVIKLSQKMVSNIIQVKHFWENHFNTLLSRNVMDILVTVYRAKLSQVKLCTLLDQLNLNMLVLMVICIQLSVDVFLMINLYSLFDEELLLFFLLFLIRDSALRFSPLFLIYFFFVVLLFIYNYSTLIKYDTTTTTFLDFCRFRCHGREGDVTFSIIS